MNVAIIPARGGSKRIPRKNIRTFLGQPIICYSIHTALASGLFERVIVSTDDAEIAAIAERAGAAVPFLRPSALADDFSGTNAVVCHALEELRKVGVHPDTACCIYATAPLLTIDALQKGWAVFNENVAEFAFSVAALPVPVERTLRRTGDGRMRMIDPAHALTRTQDLERAWYDAAQFYFGRTEAFLSGKSMFEGNAVGVPIPSERVQDIDDEDDWQRAELLYRMLQEKLTR